MSNRTYIAALLVITGLVAGIVALTAKEPVRPKVDAADAVERDDYASSATSRERRGNPWFGGATDDQLPESTRVTAEEPSPSTDAGSLGTVIAQPEADAGAGAEWADPTNERVLGKKTWMAPIDTDEERRIDEVFEAARAARADPRLPDRSRASSIEAVRIVTDRCFEAMQQRNPAASGRLILTWTAAASGGQGTISEPSIKLNYKLSDPLFESCILNGLQSAKFAGADGDPIIVEAPFFYDGSY